MGRVGNVSASHNKGRTASHEVGHWLSLYHLWGDAVCGDDFVAETPPQDGPNAGCPNYPLPSGCINTPYGEMFMNYMDNTDDACVNVFTTGQRSRGKAIFAPGGPRAPFLNNYFQIQPPTRMYCSGKVYLFNPNCLPVTWSVIAGTATLSANTNTEVTISSTTAGLVTLQASAGNYITEQTVRISLDKPWPTKIAYTVQGVEYPVREVSYGIPDEICLLQEASPIITFGGANSVLWTKTSSPSVAYDNYSHSFYFSNTSQFLNLQVRGTNACGNTSVYANFVEKLAYLPEEIHANHHIGSLQIPQQAVN